VNLEASYSPYRPRGHWGNVINCPVDLPWDPGRQGEWIPVPQMGCMWIFVAMVSEGRARSSKSLVTMVTMVTSRALELTSPGTGITVPKEDAVSGDLREVRR
jgi:hypothetical protein